jgi:calcineurin-like phosphoesterase family protein
MTNFYISDTHFDHAKIITLAKRPFANVDEMNGEMVKRWNNVVADDDTVFHLGDFAWKFSRYEYWKSQLKGKIVFIRGNHDPDMDRKLSSDYVEILDDPYNLVLFHYPIVSWNGMFRGHFHFYGHVHGDPLNHMPLDWRARAFDVGVECLDYTPKTAEQIIMKDNA